jgi:hypothetical protein
VAFRKLVQLDRSRSLDDLRVPPGNRLEPLGLTSKSGFLQGSCIGQSSLLIILSVRRRVLCMPLRVRLKGSGLCIPTLLVAVVALRKLRVR